MLPQDFAVNQKIVHPTDGEGRVTFVDPMLQRLKLKYPEEKFERMYNFYLPNGSVSPILLDIIPFVKAKKHPTPTEVQLAQTNDPELLPIFYQHYKTSGSGEILISCQSSRVAYEAERISACSCLSATEAVDYISPASEKTHAAKFYVVVSNKECDELFDRMSAFFKVRTTLASISKYQYNCRSLAEWLMKTHGELPRIRV